MHLPCRDTKLLLVQITIRTSPARIHFDRPLFVPIQCCAYGCFFLGNNEINRGENRMPCDRSFECTQKPTLGIQINGKCRLLSESIH